MKELVERCSKATGYEGFVVESILTQFLAEIADELSAGLAVDLGENFGTFSVKLRTAHLAENSPRTPKNSRYKVIFRENKGLK